MDDILHNMLTEKQNENTRHVDTKSTIEILRLINSEDKQIASAVEACIPQIAKATDAIVKSFKRNGRLLYFGAGTSGRLGILDAAECPPTFRTDPRQVQGIIAGGSEAIQQSVEGAEDDEELGKHDVESLHVNSNDVVVGIAASGRTPYVIGAMKRGLELGATVVGISNNLKSSMRKHANIMIEAVVGPEVLLGSTRMKSGTAQKLILNMLTTSSMILTGKVYDNLMVDMQTSNHKLVHRAKRLIQIATGADNEIVEEAYTAANGHVKSAIVMILLGISYNQADELLNQTNGFVREAIKLSHSKTN